LSVQSCTRCGEVKSLTDFVKSNQCKSGYCRTCKDCERIRARSKRRGNPEAARSAQLRLKYGITSDVYHSMLAGQRVCCKICQRTPEAGDRALSVDHCHRTGLVRGLLCGHCNTGLGMFKDDPGFLRRAAAYIESASAYKELTE
jgi:hypothetical protein